MISVGAGGLYLLAQVMSNGRGKFKLLGLKRDPPLQFSALVGHSDLSIRKILLGLIGLLTAIILKKER